MLIDSEHSYTTAPHDLLDLFPSPPVGNRAETSSLHLDLCFATTDAVPQDVNPVSSRSVTAVLLHVILGLPLLLFCPNMLRGTAKTEIDSVLSESRDPPKVAIRHGSWIRKIPGSLLSEHYGSSYYSWACNQRSHLCHMTQMPRLRVK